MNQKDLKIISHLRQDARMSLTEMSKKSQIPVSTIFDRINSKEGDYIVKHTALLNFGKLGYNTIANVMLAVDRNDKDPLKEYLIKHYAVNSIYKINNGFDFMVEVIFRQIKDMEDFIDLLESKFKIKDKKSFFIIDSLKKEAFLSDPELLKVYDY